MSGAAARWPFTLAVSVPPLAFGAAALTRPLQDPDLFWLMEAGRRLRVEGLALDNGWSWTAPEHPWVLHEPLVALAYSAAGWAGLPWLRAALLCALLLGLVRLAQERGAWAACLSLCFTLPLVSVGLSERAMASGALIWLGTLSALAPWSDAPLPHARRALAAGLVVLGSAVHGSFALGLVVLGLYAGPWALLAALGALALPGGVDRAALLLHYAGQDPTLTLARGFVEEWTPLWPDDAAWALRSGLAFLCAGAMLARGGWRARLLALLLLSMSLRHRRFVLELGVAALPWLAAWLATRVPDREAGPSLGLTALGLLGLSALSPSGEPDPRRYPADTIEAARGDARTWSDLRLGAWLASEGVPPFWDARNDCYPAEVYAEGLHIATRSDAWTHTLALWEIEQVVTGDPTLAEDLRAMGWRERGQAGAPSLWVLRSPGSVDTLTPN